MLHNNPPRIELAVVWHAGVCRTSGRQSCELQVLRQFRRNVTAKVRLGGGAIEINMANMRVGLQELGDIIGHQRRLVDRGIQAACALTGMQHIP